MTDFAGKLGPCFEDLRTLPSLGPALLGSFASKFRHRFWDEFSATARAILKAHPQEGWHAVHAAWQALLLLWKDAFTRMGDREDPVYWTSLQSRAPEFHTQLAEAEALLRSYEEHLGPLLDPSSPLGGLLRWLIRNDPGKSPDRPFMVAAVQTLEGNKTKGELHVFALMPGPPPGPGQDGALTGHPMNFLGGAGDHLFNETLGHAFRSAWRQSPDGSGGRRLPAVIYRWLGYAGEDRIPPPGCRWEGSSASGAFAMALMEHFEPGLCYDAILTMASIDAEGHVHPVDGVGDKVLAVISFNERIRSEKLDVIPIDTIVLTQDNHEDAERAVTATKSQLNLLPVPHPEH